MNHAKSIEAFNHAKESIPGGVSSPVRAFSSVGGTPPFIQRGQGAYMYDIDGNRYIDFVQSWGPLILGHGDEDVINAVTNVVRDGLSFGAPTELETQLADEIVDLFGHIDKVRFVNSGTEAVMSAIRLARGYTGRDDIIKFTGNYHGHSDSLLVQAGSGAATFGSPSSPGVPADVTKHTLLAQYNDLESLKQCFEQSSGVACVIMEPIAGNMGLVAADEKFLQQVRALCDEHGALLIFDEVMSGFRASLQGAQGLVDTVPDITTFGKVIGGGMPVGAFGASKEIMSHLSPEGPVYQAGTLSGNPVAMAAGLTTLKKLKEQKELYAGLEAKAKRLTEGLKEAADRHDVALQVDYRGSMFGFFFNDNPVTSFEDAAKSDTQRFGRFHQAMLDRGIYFACSQFEAGFINTQITDAMIDIVLQNANEVLASLK